MIATPDTAFILTLSGNGTAYLYDARPQTPYVDQPVPAPSGSTIQGYYGPLGAGPGALLSWPTG